MTTGSLRHAFDLAMLLAQKDFKLRYRNSVLGFLWSLLNPIAYMSILTLVFSLLLRVQIANFAAWVLIGLLIWRFFSIGTTQGLYSILANPSLVNRVYIPRYIIVLGNNLANFVGAGLEFLALIPLLVILGVSLSLYVLFLPVVLILEFLVIFGLSLSLASLNLKYRDFYQLWEIALQLGFFISPIVYDSRIVPSKFQFLYSVNPVTQLIESSRGIFLRQSLPSLLDVSITLAMIGLLLLTGLLIFRSLEVRFAEEL